MQIQHTRIQNRTYLLMKMGLQHRTTIGFKNIKFEVSRAQNNIYNKVKGCRNETIMWRMKQYSGSRGPTYELSKPIFTCCCTYDCVNNKKSFRIQIINRSTIIITVKENTYQTRGLLLKACNCQPRDSILSKLRKLQSNYMRVN